MVFYLNNINHIFMKSLTDKIHITFNKDFICFCSWLPLLPQCLAMYRPYMQSLGYIQEKCCATWWLGFMWQLIKVYAEPLCQSLLLLPSSLLVFAWGLLSIHFPLNNGCDSSCFYIYSVYSYGDYGDNLTVVYIPHYSVMVICIRFYWIPGLYFFRVYLQIQ